MCVEIVFGCWKYSGPSFRRSRTNSWSLHSSRKSVGGRKFALLRQFVDSCKADHLWYLRIGVDIRRRPFFKHRAQSPPVPDANGKIEPALFDGPA